MTKNLDTLTEALMNAPFSKLSCLTKSEIDASEAHYRSIFERTFATTIAPYTYKVTKHNHFTGNSFEGYDASGSLTIEVLKDGTLLWRRICVDPPSLTELTKSSSKAYEKISRLYEELDKKFKKGEVIPHRQEETTFIN